MKLCKVCDLIGNEVLARSIMTDELQELLTAGTVLKPEYIAKIEQLGIQEVIIENTRLRPEQVVILREDVGDIFREKVKSVLERHIYSNSDELRELSSTADNIIMSILDKDAVVEQIFDIKERSADIYDHSISVCSLAVLLAIKIKLPMGVIHDLGVAALFHDIGLRYLDFAYTNQMSSSLSELKLTEYRKHPIYAYTSLKEADWLSNDSKNMILQHHERLDGSGYPLHTTEFEITTKILQVCDAFDEMICGIGCTRARVYEAVEFLKVNRGITFDAETVNGLLEFTAVYPAGTVVKTNEGEWGVVIRQNKQFPERPVLRIVKDKDGNPIEEKTYDLLEVHNIFIDKVIM